MLKLSNISIGLKLSIMSVLGVTLVGNMIGVSMYTGSLVRSTEAYAEGQTVIIEDLKKIEDDFVLARLAMRDIRLAQAEAELQAANTLSSLQKSINTTAEKLVAELRVPANRERMQDAHRRINAYIDGATMTILPMQAEIIKRVVTNPDRVAQLRRDMAEFQKQKLDPDVAASVKAMGEIAHIAEGLIVQ